jgi:uncharacterized protein with HEPN domain
VKDDKFYLIHILESIARIEQYVAGDRGAFMASSLVQDAVVRNLQVLAESTQRLSDQMKARYTEVPWRDIAGLRNILVHDYLGVDLDQVWKILERDLPRLKADLNRILRAL